MADAKVTPVKIVEDQPPIQVVQVAPDGVTPVPIASLGAAANTPPGSDAPVGQPTPTPVAATGTPVNVTVMAPAAAQPTVTKGEGTTLSPTTTEADDEVTRGQRRVNILWESVQAIIAISVTFAIVYLAIVQTPAETITNAFFLIVGFYFSRTNHSAQGGVGPKPNEPYMGR